VLSLKVTDTKNEDGVHVKNDPDDIEIKDELMELPLDVTLVSDGDCHVDTKVNSTDDDRSIPGECKKIIYYVDRAKRCIILVSNVIDNVGYCMC
jgi:hypothetical protein